MADRTENGKFKVEGQLKLRRVISTDLALEMESLQKVNRGMRGVKNLNKWTVFIISKTSDGQTVETSDCN